MREICAWDRREERKRREKYGKERGRREKNIVSGRREVRQTGRKGEQDVVYRETEAVIRE